MGKPQRIDKELLLRRAEHNDGDLSTLREITLHQFDLEKIENLDVYCRNLEILYLQNNQIGKIENLHKLKSLRYLNLALNNIRRIENLSRCESLTKLDLTVNFVDSLLDVEALRDCQQLRELYLIGNPISAEEDYRKFVIATLPQLLTLDSMQIEKSERIVAQQELPCIRERLLRKAKENGAAGVDESVMEADVAVDHEERSLDSVRESFQSTPTSHTPEERLRIARELAELRAKPETPSNPLTAKPAPPSLVAPDGRILRRNEGKWLFHLNVTPNTVVLDVEISKFVDTSLIDLDVHPTWLRCTIKGKVLQLVLDSEVRTDSVLAERSKHSGHLVVTMLKVESTAEGDLMEIRRKARADEELQRKGELEEARRKAATMRESKLDNTRRKRYEKLLESAEGVNYRNMVSLGEDGRVKPHTSRADSAKDLGQTKILDRKMVDKVDVIVQDDFLDDPDVPALE